LLFLGVITSVALALDCSWAATTSKKLRFVKPSILLIRTGAAGAAFEAEAMRPHANSEGKALIKIVILVIVALYSLAGAVMAADLAPREGSKAEPSVSVATS
jgi:hypothetical protein